jgi:tRNA-2-methylthio-N6-dimethylallyladenosine synthase
LTLMEYCKYDLAYMFYYSERPGTLAARRYKDDVPEAIKKSRLQEVVALHRIHALESMKKEVGKTAKVLIEGDSKKSSGAWAGRTDQNKIVVFEKDHSRLNKGDYVFVKIKHCTSATLIGEIVENGD